MQLLVIKQCLHLFSYRKMCAYVWKYLRGPMQLTCQADLLKRSIGIFQRGKAGLDIGMLWLVFSSALLSFYVDRNQTVPRWAHAQRDRFVLGTPSYNHINANRLKKGQALLGAFLEVFCWVWAVGQRCMSCSLGPAEAQHKDADWSEVGERLVGEMKAGETPWHHLKLGPQAHLCTWCQCCPQCHGWAFWTWVMASALLNYRPLCLVMWCMMCLVLFIPCNPTQRSWAEPRLPPRGGCPHGMLLPGLNTQKGFASIWVSIPTATP